MFVLILSLILNSPALLQNPQTPPVKGTGKISGLVTDGTSGKPIAGATVRMIRWEGGRGTQASGRTGADGRFSFAELFGGSYQVNVTAEHYVGLEFGQRAPGEPGRRIELAEGMQFDKADFALPARRPSRAVWWTNSAIRSRASRFKSRASSSLPGSGG